MTGPLGDFLERFRRAGGVPAAVGGDLAAELAPVFSALDEIEREADALRTEAETRRSEREEQLGRELDRILADGRARAEQARDRAFGTALAAARAEAEAIVAEGARDAEAIRRRGTARLPGLVDAVVARLAGGGP